MFAHFTAMVAMVPYNNIDILSSALDSNDSHMTEILSIPNVTECLPNYCTKDQYSLYYYLFNLHMYTFNGARNQTGHSNQCKQYSY